MNSAGYQLQRPLGQIQVLASGRNLVHMCPHVRNPEDGGGQCGLDAKYRPWGQDRSPEVSDPDTPSKLHVKVPRNLVPTLARPIRPPRPGVWKVHAQLRAGRPHALSCCAQTQDPPPEDEGIKSEQNDAR